MFDRLKAKVTEAAGRHYRRQAAKVVSAGPRGEMCERALLAGVALGRRGVRAEGGQIAGWWPELAPLSKEEREIVRVAVAQRLVDGAQHRKAG